MTKEVVKQLTQGNTLTDYLVFVALFLSSVLVLRLMHLLIVKRFKRESGKAQDSRQKLRVYSIERKFIPILFTLSLYFSIQVISMPEKLSEMVNIAFFTSMVFFSVRIIVTVATAFVETYWKQRETDSAKQQSIGIIVSIIKIVIWGIAVFILLDNLGVNITALLAGLGIGGIAIALAAQTILGDLFSCFVIFFDRPFEIGDYINIDTFSGTIEHIGIKTTRIRSLSGEQLIFSNTDLTTARLRNYKRMERRRINFKFSVTYQTEHEKLQEIPALVSRIVTAITDTEYERTHFSSYGDSGLLFDVVYYVTTGDYIRYMDIQQEINLSMKLEFEKRGIDFAYPTQTIHISDAVKPKRGKA
jgi:small-conductance mechanosensitive channel